MDTPTPAIKNFAAAMTLLGVRLPEAPQYPSIIEGPFYASAQINGPTAPAEINLFDALAADRKLYSVGFTGPGARPTGLLWLDAVGAEIVEDTNGALGNGSFTRAAVNSYQFCHVPQGGQREQAIALAHFADTIGQTADNSTAADVRSPLSTAWQVGSCVQFPGGSWKINSQGDQFALRRPQSLPAFPIAAPFLISFRIKGVYLTQAYATDLGLLDSAGNVCVPDAAQIQAVLASRKNLGQSY